ncbi:hypothetical protein [Falsirhodobacter sp. 1013]|uniref:hypothetical protein n=1 Tax=Falsirhodobacter sp. 1013 TaxID=3417566 RepID=UPI003EBC66E2
MQRLRSTGGLRYVALSPQRIFYKKEDLDSFIEDRTQQCHTARKARASGTMTSKSGVVDFTALAGRKTTPKPRR